MRYTAEQLNALPTLKSGHFDNLKLDHPDYEVWFSRANYGDYFPSIEPACSVPCHIATVVFKDGVTPIYTYIAQHPDGLTFLRQKVLRKIAEYEGKSATLSPPRSKVRLLFQNVQPALIA